MLLGPPTYVCLQKTHVLGAADICVRLAAVVWEPLAPPRLLTTVLHSSLLPRSDSSGARELSLPSSSRSMMSSADGSSVDPDSENDVSPDMRTHSA